MKSNVHIEIDASVLGGKAIPQLISAAYERRINEIKSLRAFDAGNHELSKEDLGEIAARAAKRGSAEL